MTTTRTVVLILLFAMCALAPATWAQSTSPDAHIGIITAVGQRSVTVKDMTSGTDLLLVAAPELLRGFAVKDRVTVTFVPEGQTLVLKSLKKESP